MRRRPCARSGRRASRQCSTKRSSIATRWPRPITCGCMVSRQDPAVDVRVHPVELRLPDLEHLARRRAALPVRVEVELEVHPVVELEAERQLPDRRLAAALERDTARHLVADARVERPVVVGHQARVVEEAELLDEGERRLGEVGRRCAEAERRDADALEHGPGALHVGPLLVRRLQARVDVRVGVVGDLVPGLEDRGRLVRKRLDRVAGDEEGRVEIVLVEKAEDARDADARAVFAAVEHRRRTRS